MTENDDIENRVAECLRHVVGERANGVGPYDLLRDVVANFDSLAAAEYIAAIEEHFDIEVDYVVHDVRFRMGTISTSAEFVRELLVDREVLRG